MFTNSRVFVMEMHDQQNVDVDIKLNKTAFLSLFKGASFEELIESDEIDINGSVKTAQQLADLLALASIDVEELVSHYTGDILSLIHICRCRRYAVCRSRWSPYH